MIKVQKLKIGKKLLLTNKQRNPGETTISPGMKN